MSDETEDPVAFTLNECIIDRVDVGDFSYRGEEIRSIEPPVKGFPAWKFQYFDGTDDRIIITAHVPIRIEGIMVKPIEVLEDEIPEDE